MTEEWNDEMLALGRIAFEAYDERYRELTGLSDLAPGWPDLDPEVRAAWTAGIAAAIEAAQGEP